MKKFTDDTFQCGLYNGALEEYKREIQDMTQKVSATHDNVETMVNQLQHLTRLELIAETLIDVKNELISAATGKNHVPVEVVERLFIQNSKNQWSQFKSYSLIVIVLLAVLLFLLTGEHFGWIRHLVTPVK